MTNAREKLDALIAKLEALTGPDREVDGHIAVVLGWRHFELGANIDKYKAEGWPWMDFGDCWMHPGDNETYGDVNLRNKKQSYDDQEAGRWDGPPKWTSSIDAALGLVPEGWVWEVSEWEPDVLREKGPYYAITKPRGGPTKDVITSRCQYGPTPAIALTIAALKAIAAEEG